MDKELNYVTGVKYRVPVKLRSKEVKERIVSELGDKLSEDEVNKIVSIMEDNMELGNPVVDAKWTTLKKESSGSESLKKKKVVNKKAKVGQTRNI